MNESLKDGIWFVYDGECPMCNAVAYRIRIKKDYGTIHLINARESTDHPLLIEINKHGFDLDEGMVIYANDRFYHGKDALKFMAKYGDPQNILMTLSKGIFWSNHLGAILYPCLRAIRNGLLRRKNVGRIDNLNFKTQPIFQSIFGAAWDQLPPVFHKHYANRPYTNDKVTVNGIMDVSCNNPIKSLSPLFWLMCGIPPHAEKNVPVTVHFESDKHSKAFHFNRIFHFNATNPYSFRSRMIQIKDSEVVEIMRFGIGWRMDYLWEDHKVKLKHKGYVWHIFGHFMPLPLETLIGKGYAEETSVDDNIFDTVMRITHPWWGKIYEYKGHFAIQDH